MSSLSGQYNLFASPGRFEPIAYNPFTPVLFSRDPVRIHPGGINGIPTALNPAVQQVVRLNLCLADTDLSHSKAQRGNLNIGSGKPHAIHHLVFCSVTLKRSTPFKVCYITGEAKTPAQDACRLTGPTATVSIPHQQSGNSGIPLTLRKNARDKRNSSRAFRWSGYLNSNTEPLMTSRC
jgi:hypothetical protein